MQAVFILFAVLTLAFGAGAQDQAIQQFLAENRFGPYAAPKDTAANWQARTHGSYDLPVPVDSINTTDAMLCDSDTVIYEPATIAMIDDSVSDTASVEQINITVVDTTGDTVLEEHLVRLIFDSTYSARSLVAAGQHVPVWQSWEEYYFNREQYQKRLEEFLLQHWSIGPSWWQAEVKVEVPNELDRGGPIFFKVDYPLLDWCDDLVFQVTKQADQTVISVNGNFHGQKRGYLAATFIMLLSMVIVAGITWFVGKWLWRIFNALVTALANGLTNGRGGDIWAWRFSACLVGATFCAIVLIASVFI